MLIHKKKFNKTIHDNYIKKYFFIQFTFRCGHHLSDSVSSFPHCLDVTFLNEMR